MTAAAHTRPVVSVDELQRAWRALQSGQFRGAAQPWVTKRTPPHTSQVWTASPDEQVLPVVRCPGAQGATTFALALATAAEQAARVVECSAPTSSGLAAASTAELGDHPSGWAQGTRGEVLLQRTSTELAGVSDVPPPLAAQTTTLTVLDVAWDLGHVLRTPSWVATHITQATAVVVVSCATVPGLRHLESALGMLGGTPTVVVIIGPPRKRWPKTVQHSAGSSIRAAECAGRLVGAPWDRRLAIAGLNSTPLPAPLLRSAETVLTLVDQVRTGSP